MKITVTYQDLSEEEKEVISAEITKKLLKIVKSS